VRLWPSLACGLLLIAAGVKPAMASSITCGSATRKATLESAAECATVGLTTGTPKADDVAAQFTFAEGFDDWTARGSATAGPGGNTTTAYGNGGGLTVAFTTGKWNSNNVAGTWTIANGFWDAYANAVITMHVGNGNSDPDWFLFLVTPGAYSGTFKYDRLSAGGGGFSNMFLFSEGTPPTITTTAVPDGGTTLAMLGFALAGLGALGRKLSR
jgi:hypothetical protein